MSKEAETTGFLSGASRVEREISRPIEAAAYADVRETVNRLTGRQIPGGLAALFDLEALGWVRLGAGTEDDDSRPVYLAGIWGTRVVVDFPAPPGERESADSVDFRLAGVGISRRRRRQRLLVLRYAADSGRLEGLTVGLTDSEAPDLLKALYERPVDAYHPGDFDRPSGPTRPQPDEISGWMLDLTKTDWLLEVSAVEEGLRAPGSGSVLPPLIQLKTSERKLDCWRLDFVSPGVISSSFYLPKRLD